MLILKTKQKRHPQILKKKGLAGEEKKYIDFFDYLTKKIKFLKKLYKIYKMK